MTETSGLGMRTRNRQEAEKIARSHFSDFSRLRYEQVNQLIEVFTQYSPYFCDNCYKSGTTIQIFLQGPNAQTELVTSACVCSDFRRINEKLQVNTELAGIPVKYRSVTIDDWNDPARNDEERSINNRSFFIIKSYVDKLEKMLEKGYGLFLCGPNGVGKTYLACAVAVRAIRDSYRVKYYTMSKIVRTVVDGWYDDDKKVVVNDIEESDFLVIDDLDKAYQSKTRLEISVLDNLFRERLQNNRPMLVTSNRILTQIRETHGEAIYSMFSEHCALCAFLGQDYRKKIAGDMVDDILGS